MAGAYGNVGAVCYLTLFTFVTPSQFFLIIGAGAFISFGLCLLYLVDISSCWVPWIASGTIKSHAVPNDLWVWLDRSGLDH